MTLNKCEVSFSIWNFKFSKLWNIFKVIENELFLRKSERALVPTYMGKQKKNWRSRKSSKFSTCVMEEKILLSQPKPISGLNGPGSTIVDRLYPRNYWMFKKYIQVRLRDYFQFSHRKRAKPLTKHVSEDIQIQISAIVV